MWEHLFLLGFGSAAHAAQNPRDELARLRQTHERRHARRLLFQERPLLITTAHFGNFEVGGYVLGILGFPTFTVARTLDNPYLDRFVNEFRSRTGKFIIPKNGGYDQIEAVLRQRHDDVSGRSIRRTQGLLDRVLQPAGLAHKAIAL